MKEKFDILTAILRFILVLIIINFVISVAVNANDILGETKDFIRNENIRRNEKNSREWIVAIYNFCDSGEGSTNGTSITCK